MSSNLLERIDQKLSFILSSLVGKQKIKPEDIQSLEVEKGLLLEQFENERELLFNETVKLEETIDNQLMIDIASKIFVYCDAKISNDEEYKTEVLENIIFDDLDVENIQKNRTEIINYILKVYPQVEKQIIVNSLQEIVG